MSSADPAHFAPAPGELHVLAALDQSVALYGVDGTILYWNAASERTFGRALAEVTGHTLWTVFPETHGTPFHEAFTRVASSGKPERIEMFFAPWQRWFDSQFYRLDEGVLVVASETTPRKKLEAELEAEHARRAEEALLHATLHRLASVLSSNLDYESIVQRVTDEGRALCDAEFGAFFYNVADDAGERYTLYTLSGAPREAFERFGMPRNTAVFAPTFSGEGIVRSDDITKDPRYGKSAPHHGMPKGHLPVRSYLAVPVLSKDRSVIGGLFFGHSKTGVFNALHERLLEGVATHAAIALDNAALYREAQRARRAAEADRQRYELVNRATNDVIRDWNIEADAMTWNDSVASLGYERDALQGRSDAWLSRVHALDRDRVQARLQEAIAGSSLAWGDEYRFLRRDGGYAHVLDRGLFVRNERGRATRLVATMLDITARREAERAAELVARASRTLGASFEMEQTAAAFAGLFVPDWADIAAVFITRENDRPALVGFAHGPVENVEAVRDQLAHSASKRERPARAMVIAVLDDDAMASAGNDGDLLAGLKEAGVRSCAILPLTIQHRDVGSLLLLSTQADHRYEKSDLPLLDDVAGRAAMALEVSRLFQAAERDRIRAEEASRAKDEFLAVVSHELRTPMNAILGWSKMLAGGLVGGERATRAAHTIERNARAQAQLIEDLLDISRIITGKLRIDVAPVDMASVVEAAIEVVRPAADAKGVRIQSLIAHDAGPLLGDADRLQQVIWNLLSNAVKFTPRGGRVSVRVQRTASACEITVEDSGAGITPDFLPFVFERFLQADSGTTRAQGGLGLGLAIVRHLVELHGGTVAAHSDGLGKGAAFTVRLPIAPLRRSGTPHGPGRSSTPVPTPTTELCPPEIDGLRVLVVDDEPDARELLASLLEGCKVHVMTASSVAQAMELLSKTQFDVIVSDIGMPEEDGYSFVEKLRALPDVDVARTPAIALTAYARAEDRTRALIAGFNMHVAKPIDPHELVVVVASAAGRRGKRPSG